MLEVDTIHTYYGEGHVLHGISLTVQEGEGVGTTGRERRRRSGASLGSRPRATAGSSTLDGPSTDSRPNKIARLEWVSSRRAGVSLRT